MNRLIHGLKLPCPIPLPPPCPQPIGHSSSSTKSFNAIINRLSSQGAHHQVLQTYASMQKTSTPPDAYTFPSLLKACTILNLFSYGLSLHQSLIVNGLSHDSFIGSSLISFYAKFGCIGFARKVFDTMPERNVVPWTTIIGCYSWEEEIGVAFSMFKEMRVSGVQPTSVTLLSLLPGISELPLLQCLHCWTILFGFQSDLALSNSMVNMYGRCGSIEDARSLFESMDYRDIVSWNSLLSAYIKIGGIGEILQLLYGMRTEDIKPDKQTFCSALSASAIKGDIRLGKLVHALILKDGLDMDPQVDTALTVLYLRCRSLDLALKVFKSTTEKDVVLWTAMISGLVQNDCADKALEVFYQMLESNVELGTATLASALAACAQLSCYDIGTSIHGYILRQGIMLDIPARNSLVTMYAKCNKLEQSCAIFNKMVEKDLVSWNAIVAGHAKNGYLSMAIFFFNEMRTSLQRPDSITVTSLLQACGSAGALCQGKWIHNFIFRSSLLPCIMIETALVDMYFKCGNLETAQKCFDCMLQQDLVTWSTLIAGYGFQGKGEIALRKYSEFLGTGMEPNHVIFLSILSACSHSGLIKQGLSIYESMTKDFRMPPNHEHRACIVDLLSRAGKVEEAYSFYKMMFTEPSIDVLGILLDACRVNGSVELGEVIARDIFALKPVDAGNYVQLAHSYASMSRWDGVEEAWTQMRSLGLKKLPGWSSIEEHHFVIGMGLDQCVAGPHDRIDQPHLTWNITVHSLSDLSYISPVVFLYLLKECYIRGTLKATKKFRFLQQQVHLVLHNGPRPGPATFVIHCLYVLPIFGLYSEGFSHLITSALQRFLKVVTTLADLDKAKDLAAQLFMDIVEGCIEHDERIVVKILQVFDVQLTNIEKVLYESKARNRCCSGSAKDFVEQYVSELIESQSYVTAVDLLEHFSIHQSGQSLLYSMLENKEFKAAEKWATFMGKPMLCLLVQELMDRNKVKSAYGIIKKNDLQKEFPDVYQKCKESSLKKLAEKGCWDVAEAKTNSNRQLLEYLVYLALEAGYFEKVDELCNRYSLTGFLNIKECEGGFGQNHYLSLNQLIAGDILWIDKADALHHAIRHIEECKVVGVDCEWKPNYIKGSKPNKVSIMQIASEKLVFIFDLIKLYDDVPDILDNCLTRILQSSRILKLGYNFQCDIKQLSHSYESLQCFKHYELLLDIQNVFKEHRGGLSGLAKKILGAGLNKTRRNSDWEQRPLMVNQLEYAALDAVVLVHIFRHVRDQSQPSTTAEEGQKRLEWKSFIVSHMDNPPKPKKKKNTSKMELEVATSL